MMFINVQRRTMHFSWSNLGLLNKSTSSFSSSLGDQIPTKQANRQAQGEQLKRTMNPEFEAYWNMNHHEGKPVKIHFKPSERNKEPILTTIQKHVASSSSGKFLEISSGSGQHVAFIAPKFPEMVFQPTEVEGRLRASISEYIKTNGLTNVLQPLNLDVSDSADRWAQGSLQPNTFDYVLNINMMHVSPWACTEGLFRGCSVVLKPGGMLFTYGAFSVNGIISPESNVQFDRNLKTVDPSWGLRDIQTELIPLASQVGMKLTKSYELPAANQFLVWQKFDKSQ